MDQESVKRPSKWAVVMIVAIGVFMATLDSSIVNISLPAIATYFSVPLNGAVEWVVIAYLIATTAVLLTAGRLADMVGRKIVWSAGLIIFTVGSALCAAAPNLGVLIAARLFQGIGGALLMAVSLALLTSAFSEHERGHALGLNAITVSLGITVGPTLGGFITQSFSWRWIFYINVPIGMIGLILTLRILTEHVRRNPGCFDPLGALLLAAGLTSLTAGFSFGQELGWSSLLILVLLFVGIVMLVTLPFIELRVPNPVIVLSLLKNRVFTSALFSLILNFLAFFAISFILPFYLEELRGFSTQKAGLLLTPPALVIAIIAPISGSLADRFGTRWLTTAGLAIACMGLVLISQLDEHSTTFDIICRLAVTGFGQALFQSPNNSALMGAAPRELQGSASGFLATGRVFGQTLSIALAGAIFASLGGAAAGQAITTRHLTQGQFHVLQQIFVYGFHITFLSCAVITAFGIFTSSICENE